MKRLCEGFKMLKLEIIDILDFFDKEDSSFDKEVQVLYPRLNSWTETIGCNM